MLCLKKFSCLVGQKFRRFLFHLATHSVPSCNVDTMKFGGRNNIYIHKKGLKSPGNVVVFQKNCYIEVWASTLEPGFTYLKSSFPEKISLCGEYVARKKTWAYIYIWQYVWIGNLVRKYWLKCHKWDFRHKMWNTLPGACPDPDLCVLYKGLGG